MSIATLLNARDPAFDFEHRKAHETMLLKQAQASLNFAGLPYWIDPPMVDQSVPAGWGNSLHAQAHKDFIGLFPAPFGGSGVASLNDIVLLPEPDPWWEFSNFQLHYTASQIR